MNVKNRKCIRKLSLKSLYANRRRNLIAIFAIALTTLLFTSMFTIVLSLNASYETYQFRQVGGYAHGTFKDVSPEQAERIAAHPKVKATGARKVIGITAEGVFAKIPAEISYMDANCTKWSYATPTTGRMPESGKEVAMDTAALQLLGVTPELGAEVTVSYSITDKDQTAFTVTDTFTLVGYWDYDELMPVHYINISRDYADDIEAQAVKTGLQPFRTDLNVMLTSGTNIQGQMEQVDTDLGYTWDSYTDPNSVRIGVNWGYTSSQLESQLDPELMIAIAAFLLLVIFTGYLIIFHRELTREHISKNEYLDHEMDNAVTFFSENYNQNISIDDYAASRGMSVSWFIRNFKKYTGSTPMQFIVGIRINNAQMLLETTTYSINEISKIVGYDNQLYFSRLFHKLKGYSPREYRKIRNKF